MKTLILGALLACSAANAHCDNVCHEMRAWNNVERAYYDAMVGHIGHTRAFVRTALVHQVRELNARGDEYTASLLQTLSIMEVSRGNL